MRPLFHGDYVGSDRSALKGRVKPPTRAKRAWHLALTRHSCYPSAKNEPAEEYSEGAVRPSSSDGHRFPRDTRWESGWNLRVGLVDVRRVRRELQRRRLRRRHPTRPRGPQVFSTASVVQ